LLVRRVVKGGKKEGKVNLRARIALVEGDRALSSMPLYSEEKAKGGNQGTKKKKKRSI